MTRENGKVTVLILAREAVIAGLLGVLLELEGYEPAFPADGERPEEALARVHPPLVLMLDGELDSAHSDLFLARAAKARAGVVVFGPPHDPDGAIAALARRRGLPHVGMPCSRAELAGAVAEALGTTG